MKEMNKINEGEQIQQEQFVEEIASNIAKLSQQVSAILNGRLKRKSIVILLANSCRLTKREVEQVLQAIENMGKDNLKS